MIENNVFLIINILAPIVFLFAMFCSCDNEKMFDIYFKITAISFAFLITGLIVAGTKEWEGNEEPYAIEKIVALNDNNMVSGKAYIRSNRIQEDLYYLYMVKLNNGGFVANKVKSSKTTLYYSDSNYRVEWYKKSKKWLYFEFTERYHKIYIPKGSIVDNYSVDLN